jgi:hypothetical protein
MNKYSRQPGDSILALLEPGEYVLNRNAVNEIGRENLDELNYEDAPRFDMSQRGQFQVGGMLGDMMGMQAGGGDIPRFKNKKDFLNWRTEHLNEYEGDYEGLNPDEYGIALSKGPDKERGGLLRIAKDQFWKDNRQRLLDKTGFESGYKRSRNIFTGKYPEGERLRDLEQYYLDKKYGESLKDSLNIYSPLLGMQAGGSTLSYGGATTETQSLDDIYRRMGMQPIDEQREKFEEQYAYDPTREGVIFEDYGRAITGATQAGQQNLMGAGQKMQQAQAKSGFAGGGAGQQAMSQQRGTIMQDFLSQEGAAKSSLFKGVRSEREQWMADVSSGLNRLQGQEGTEDYSSYDGGAEHDNCNEQCGGFEFGSFQYNDCLEACYGGDTGGDTGGDSSCPNGWVWNGSECVNQNQYGGGDKLTGP